MEMLLATGGDNAEPGEFLHEQIQEAGIHSLQQRAARAASAQFTAERCFARLAMRIVATGRARPTVSGQVD